MSNFTLHLVMSDRPIIFISSVSRELHTTRDLVAKTLYSQGYDPKWEDIANSDPGNLLATIRDWIDQSAGVIQLVGHCYGGQTDIVDPAHGPLSYTQYEAVYARQKTLPVWYIILSAQHPIDGCECQPNTLHDLQSKYRDAVRSYGDRYFPSGNRDQTKIVVLELKDELKSLRAGAEKRHQKLQADVADVKRMMTENTAPGRLAAYKRSLLAAFRPYQELAIDNFAAAEQAAPDIWDIFVHPACSENHLRPEDMDAAQRETPPRLPAQDLLPLLAQADHRRTVLLADPGMGKSTLIQSLIAHLASDRTFSDAKELNGLLPIPFILRDLVPLLPPDQVENWSWNGLLTVLIEHYQRDETSPPLCDCFKDHRDEFRQITHTEAKVFFLIDGLDEIGDLAKRRQIVRCIQDGIRASNKEARWLITSRVIGYEDAPVDVIREWFHLPTNAEEHPVSADPLHKVWRSLEARRLVYEWAPIVDSKKHEWCADVIQNEKLHFVPPESENIDVHCNLLAGGRGFSLIDFMVEISVAHRLHLAPFDDKRQDLFTQCWFQYRHSTDYSRELMREIRAHHHDGVRIISRVPNLLCMMNILKRSGKPLPDGRAALYDEIVKAYLVGIDSAYRLRPILGHTCPFDAPQRRFLLALLGAHMQQTRTAQSAEKKDTTKKRITKENPESEGTILISHAELAHLLVPAIQHMRDERRVVSEHTTAELLDELLHHIASRSGLLIPRSSDAEGNTLYGFTHLSFLEFFATEWLGLEFDRQRNRIVRRTLALEENQILSENDLNREFPPHGPIQHPRETFKTLHGFSAWHEPLIFLLESRKADTPTLLRWLFPALHPTNRERRTENRELKSPRLPFATVQLVVKLAQDPEIPLSAATRQDWWRIIWSAYLAWRHEPLGYPIEDRWPIAPLLLGSSAKRSEALQALVDIYPKEGELPPNSRPPPLHLCNCHELTSDDLNQIARLTTLRSLDLLSCSGLVDTQPLASLSHLECLDLSSCTSLRGQEALRGIAKLKNLQTLLLNRCSGLTKEDVAWLREELANKCTIFGP